MKKALSNWKLDRLLFVIYLIALLVLLLFPVGGPQFRLFNIGIDKWMHVALFGGFAVFLRWNLAANPRAVIISIGAAFVVAAVTEIIQGFIAYRSADLGDLLAGLLGAALGSIGMQRIMFSPVFPKSVGLVVAILGLMIGTFFGLADVIGLGNPKQFGALQVAGIGLGALIAAGGVGVYMQASRNES